MRKTQTTTIEITADEIKDMIREAMIRNKISSFKQNTTISFKLKDVSDWDDRYSVYVLDGAKVEITNPV